MSEWTHAICDTCWANPAVRRPNWVPVDLVTRMNNPPPDTCCYCGGVTNGIYVRQDPKTMTCVHTEEV